MQRQSPLIQTVAKTVEVAPVPFVDRVVEAPVIMQINQVTKHVEIQQIRYIDEARQCPSINQVTKLADIPQTLHIDMAVDALVGMQRQVLQVQTVPETMAIPTAQSVGCACVHADAPLPQAGGDKTSVLPRAREELAKNPRSSPRLSADGQPCSAEEPRLQGCAPSQDTWRPLIEGLYQ